MPFRRIGSGLKLTRKPSKTNLRSSVSKRGSGTSDNDRVLLVRDQIQEVNNPLNWLLTQSGEHNITIILFYRGQWCPICNQQVSEWNNLWKRVQACGGQVLAVAAQPEKYAQKLQEEHKLSYPLVVDPKCLLAKALGVNVLERSSSKFKKLVEFTVQFVGTASPAYSQLTGENEYECGLTLPAVFAVNQDLDVVFSWKSKAMARNMWGSTERPNPSDVWDSVSHFLQVSSGEAARNYDYLLNDVPRAFDVVMGNPTAQEYFRKSLEKEFNAEALDFAQRAEEWKQRHRTQPGSEESVADAKDLYQTFLAPDAPKQLNLASGSGGEVGDRLRIGGSVDADLFEMVMLEVLSSLRADSFPRFMISPLFKDALNYVDVDYEGPSLSPWLGGKTSTSTSTSTSGVVIEEISEE